jgi:hypothetical protein
MNRIKRNGKKLLATTLATGCVALVLLWPGWGRELQAQQNIVREFVGICTCPCNPFPVSDVFSNQTPADCTTYGGQTCPPPSSTSTTNAPKYSRPGTSDTSGTYGLCEWSSVPAGD